jgi:hypothetical protein
MFRLFPFWGDRRQEIVFIGADSMDETSLRRPLDACLLDSPAFMPDLWRTLPDPLESWEVRAGDIWR